MKMNNSKLNEFSQIIVSTESDWCKIFEELKIQWGKRGQYSQRIILTNEDYMQLKYRLGMKLSKMTDVVAKDECFEEYFAAYKYIVIAEKLKENLERSKRFYCKTIGIYKMIVIVEVTMDEDEYKEYCMLMGIEADFLERKNI